MTLVEDIFAASDEIDNDRTPQDILNWLFTETGELMEEHIIAQGKSYKQEGDDGVVGEAIDAILCLVDLIHVVAPELSEQDLQRIAKIKLQKWKDNAKKKREE